MTTLTRVGCEHKPLSIQVLLLKVTIKIQDVDDICNDIGDMRAPS